MKGIALFVSALVLGGMGYWGLDRFRETREGKEASAGAPGAAGVPDSAAGGTAPAAASALPPTLVTPPVFFGGDPEAGSGVPQTAPGAVQGTPQTTPGAPHLVIPQPAPGIPQPAPGVPQSAAEPRRAPAQDDERSLARAAFDSGDRERGRRLLEEVYAIFRDKSGVDLSPEVERLLEAETNFARRREYVTYLARFDRSGRVLEAELGKASRKIAAAETEPEAALQAWESLTLAYELAADRSSKRKVVSQLDPFIQRMVFAGRYTPLLKSHTIQPGESLFEIAAEHRTTVDALRRLNDLKSDIIQPRQRIRVLPGKVKLFVDKSDFLLWVTLDGKLLAEYPVGLGKDNGTPTGTFVIRVRQKDPTWWRAGEPAIPPKDPRNILGTRWLGFQETQDLAGFGIHGTEDPGTIGKESSAGCVRLRNQDVEVLYDFVSYGTEVVIQI